MSLMFLSILLNTAVKLKKSIFVSQIIAKINFSWVKWALIRTLKYLKASWTYSQIKKCT